MSPDFVADQLTSIVLSIWFGGFVILLFFGYFGPHAAYQRYLPRRAETAQRSRLAGIGLLRMNEDGWRNEQADPEVERLRHKVWRRMRYVFVWTLILPVICVALLALVFTNSPAH